MSALGSTGAAPMALRQGLVLSQTRGASTHYFGGISNCPTKKPELKNAVGLNLQGVDQTGDQEPAGRDDRNDVQRIKQVDKFIRTRTRKS